MAFSIRCDWYEEAKQDNYFEKWVNHGRRVLEENCKHKDQDSGRMADRETNIRYSGYCEKCDVGEDSAQPMMNFIYPLELDNFDDEEILEVVNSTNCTVMENTESGEWFLTLTGGGMDLSQDIALAYHILEKWVPYDLAQSVCTQPELSVSGKDWIRLRKAMQESLKLYADRATEQFKMWSE